MGDFQGEIHSGDIRRQLTAMRDALAEAIAENLNSMKAKSGLCRKCGGDASAGSGIAAMTLRLRQVIADIEQLPAEEEVTRLDELSRKRNKRRTGTSNTAQPPETAG